MKYYEDKSDRKMELKLLSLSEDDKLIRECMEQASAFYGCLGKMGVTEILCDRKKAQELGADCQITGIFTGGELTAFACAFEYTGLKRNGRKWLNPGDKEWRQIETLGTNVVVIPLLVGKEKVGRLIERLREQYRDSHLLFRISGEQSEKFQEDLAVVSEKNLKTRIEQYVKKVIAETRNLSNPFIERPLGEQKAPIAACTYSKELDPKDDSPRSMLIAKELGNYGGTPDEDIPLNMIMFYQSIYGLRANKLSKFSPGCAAEGRSDGEYYKAYYEVVSQIKPKSDKTPVITPHIDRNWHIVSALPDLDEENQRRQEREIYRAFALGIICDLVCYSKISEGKYLYRLELNDLEPEEFVVSNGTPCDHYYEVLDALTINPVAVQTILSYMKEKFADERNSSGKLDFEHSYLRRQINELASIEYGKAGLSIFDVALLLKVSTPSAEFDKTVGKGIMREILTLIYEYAQTMVLEADLDGIYGKFVLEQFEMFDKNIDWYMDNWKDNFSDYINDLMRIAVSDIERKKLTDIYEKMRKIMKESSKKRG